MKPDECSSGLKVDALRIYFRECREDERRSRPRLERMLQRGACETILGPYFSMKGRRIHD